MLQPIRIALAEDHLMMRQALKAFINSKPGFTIVIDKANSDELSMLPSGDIEAVDVLLLDLYFPGGNTTDVLPETLRLWPDKGVVIFSMHSNVEEIATLFKLGVHAFVSKTAEEQELLNAIKSAYKKEIFKNRFFEEAFPFISSFKRKEVLSKKEKEMLRLIWENTSNAEIAKALCVSLSTVEKMKNALKNKVCAHSNIELIKYGLENGIIGNGM